MKHSAMIDLDDTQIAQFRADGYLIVEHIIDPGLAEMAAARFAPLFRGEFETGVLPDEVNWQEGARPRGPHPADLQRLEGGSNDRSGRVAGGHRPRLRSPRGLVRRSYHAGQRLVETAGGATAGASIRTTATSSGSSRKSSRVVGSHWTTPRVTPARWNSCAVRTAGRVHLPRRSFTVQKPIARKWSRLRLGKGSSPRWCPSSYPAVVVYSTTAGSGTDRDSIEHRRPAEPWFSTRFHRKLAT